MVALVTVPIVGAAGAAVDCGRANSVRSAMQAALNSTALAIGKDHLGLTSGSAKNQAASFFKVLFNRAEARNIDITAQLNNTDGSLTLNGSGLVDTTFARVIGIKQIKIAVTSTVIWDINKRLEVALAADNTGPAARSGKVDARK